MKNINKLLVILAVSVLLFGSCDGFLDEAPKLQQSTELTMATFSGLNKAVDGAYSPLAGDPVYGAGRVLFAEMASGNGYRFDGDFQSGRYIAQYFVNFNEESTLGGPWSYGYFIISAANNVLENLEGKENGEVSAQDIDNLRAECLFLRAFMHFDMVRLYGQAYTYQPQSPGVPVVLVTDPAGKPKRNTVKEVYDQIVEDLTTAERIIAPTYQRPGTDAKAYATLPVIQALLSRVYLNMGEWQNAADYATKVINNDSFTMWTADEYEEVWGNNTGSGEVIFEMYGEQANGYDPYWTGIAHMTDPLGYADCGTSQDLYTLYDDDDVRKKLFRRHDNAPEDHIWTTKYIGKGKGRPEVSNVVILRLSEMYLNRAEAIVNGASVAGVTAVSDMNVITSNRNVEPYVSVGSEDIFTERRKELAWEGHLWYDYPRFKKGMVRTHYNGTLNKDIPFPSHQWALPIPIREIRANENLEQNPGYN